MKKGLFGATCLASAIIVGFFDQVRGEVITVLRCFFRLGLGIVPNELRIILMGVAAQEAVVTLKPAIERPAIVGARGRHRLFRGQVPLADAVGVVALLQEDL